MFVSCGDALTFSAEPPEAATAGFSAQEAGDCAVALRPQPGERVAHLLLPRKPPLRNPLPVFLAIEAPIVLTMPTASGGGGAGL